MLFLLIPDAKSFSGSACSHAGSIAGIFGVLIILSSLVLAVTRPDRPRYFLLWRLFFAVLWEQLDLLLCTCLRCTCFEIDWSWIKICARRTSLSSSRFSLFSFRVSHILMNHLLMIDSSFLFAFVFLRKCVAHCNPFLFRICLFSVEILSCKSQLATGQKHFSNMFPRSHFG